MNKVRSLLRLLFMLDGSSISRKQMWCFFIPYVTLLTFLIPHRSQIEVLLIIFVLFYSFIVVSIKRWRDRNKSALWVLLNFVPLLNLWAAAELLLLPKAEENKVTIEDKLDTVLLKLND